MPAVLLVSTLVVPGAWADIAVPSAMVLAVYLPFLAVQMVSTAAAEEPGWREFALPRLQRRYGPVLATSVAASVGAAVVLLAIRGRLGLSLAEIEEIAAERASTAGRSTEASVLVR